MISDMSRYFDPRHGTVTSPEAQEQTFHDQVVDAIKGLLRGEIKYFLLFTLKYNPTEQQRINDIKISMDVTDSQWNDWKKACEGGGHHGIP